MSIETLIAQYGLIALFLGAGIEGETVVVAGGVLAHQALLPLPGAMVAAAAGSFVADQFFFAAGRHFRDHPRVQRMQQRPGFARALETFDRHPTGFVLAFRFLYGLRTISPIAIGTTSLPLPRFMALNAVAATLWGVLFSSLGYLFGDGIERFFGRVHPERLILGIAAAALVIGLGWFAVRRYRER